MFLPAYRLRRALFQEGFEPRLRLLVALRNGRDQRCGEIAACRIGGGDGRERVSDGEMRQGGVARNLLGDLDSFGETRPGGNEIMREADRLTFLRVIDAAGEHHVHHARGADEARQAHRAAAADEDAAAAFRQRVIGGCLGYADVARGGDFEPAADDRAVQHRDYGCLAELDALERTVPAARMGDALRDVARGELGQIEARAEMLALGGEHDGLDRVRQCGEERLDAEYGRVVDRVALFRPRQDEHGDVAPALGLERARQLVEAASGFTHAILFAFVATIYATPFPGQLLQATYG